MEFIDIEFTQWNGEEYEPRAAIRITPSKFTHNFETFSQNSRGTANASTGKTG